MKKPYYRTFANWLGHSFLLTLLWLSSVQLVQAQNMCSTTSRPDPLKGALPSSFRTTNTCYTVRVFFHFVRTTNGSGGQPVNVIPNLMQQLGAHFTPHAIYFQNMGYDEIHNDRYAVGMTNANYPSAANNVKLNELTSLQLAKDAINIYLLDDNSSFQGGLAHYTNTRTSLILGGSASYKGRIEYYVNSRTFAHEVGHCLGLFHTFDWISTGIELADGSNCTTAGDLVCDTPAESDQYAYTDDSNCEFPTPFFDPNGVQQRPDPRNIMDYISVYCQDHFTRGQGDRMRAIIDYYLLNNPTEYLSLVVSPNPPTPTFSRTSYPTVCTAGGRERFRMYVTPAPGATGYTWSLSSANPNVNIIATYNNGVEALIEFQPGDYLQTIAVTATYPCGTSTAQQTLSVTSVPPPMPELLIANDGWKCTGTGADLFAPISNYDPFTTYSITTSNNVSVMPNGVVQRGGTWGYLFHTSVTTSSMAKVIVEASNSCGGTTRAFTFLTNDCGFSYPTDSKVNAYPNPVAESLTLPKGVKEATLVNSQGRVMQKGDMSGHLNTQELPDGLYNLHMYKDGKLINQRIQVKH